MQKKLLTLVLMLIATINTLAYDFESNGIYYNILSKKSTHVQLRASLKHPIKNMQAI